VENRDVWIDYAKAIGIILVVYGHVARGLYNGGIDFPEPLFLLLDSIVYSFHMPLFFFLSGLFFYKSFVKKSASGLILSKVDTVFYPYLIWSLLQGGVEIILSNYTNGNVSLSEVLSLLWSPRAQFWFLYALFSIFTLLSVIYSLVSRRFTIPIFICSIALYLYPMLLPEGFIFGFISSNSVFFLLGIIFSMYVNIQRLSSWGYLLSLFATCVIGQWLFHGYLSFLYSNRGGESLLLAIISIVFVVSLSLFIAKNNYRTLAYIGSSSMAIYLMHILAGSSSRIVLHKFLGVDSVSIHLILGCLIGVILPLIATALVNKFKIKYVFSAPVSNWCMILYNKALKRN